MAFAALPTFFTASLVLAVTPGPGVFYVVSRTLAQGHSAGLASVGGIACGNLLNATGTALGLAALFAVSEAAFAIVRLAGAAWLVWLGVRMMRQGMRERRARASLGAVPLRVTPVSSRRLWRDGLWVATLNPKTTIFFAAFLPQFMDADAPVLVEGLALGACFVAVAACTDATYVLLAAAWAARVARARGAASSSSSGVAGMASGAVLIVLGLVSALTGSRRSA